MVQNRATEIKEQDLIEFSDCEFTAFVGPNWRNIAITLIDLRSPRSLQKKASFTALYFPSNLDN